MRLKTCTALLVFISSINISLSAQVFGGLSQSSTGSSVNSSASPSVFYYNQGQGVMIDVNLWGEVKQTGKHVIPYTTDVISLISLAGGPTSNAKLDEIRVIRYARQDSSVVERILRVNIERFIETGEQSNFPVLLRGDTVIVPGGALSVLQTFVSFISIIGTVANVYLVFTLIRERSN